MRKWNNKKSDIVNKTGDEAMTVMPGTGEIYRHFKGNLYRIVTLATHSETGEKMVVYQALYGDCEIYVRELSMFMSKVDKKKYPDAEQEQRFALMPQIIGQGAVSGESRPVQSHAQSQPDIPIPPVRPESGQVQPQSVVRPQPTVTKKEAAARPADQIQEDEAPLDPFLLQFLDADTYGEKLNLLAALHGRITDDMINTMAVSLDLEVNDGEIEERYEALKTCLLTLEKYECNRLR